MLSISKLLINSTDANKPVEKNLILEIKPATSTSTGYGGRQIVLGTSD